MHDNDEQKQQALLPFSHVGELRPPSRPAGLTGPQRRFLDRLPELDDPDAAILYQHSVLCQTVMPYKNQGDGVRLWSRSQGKVHLEIQAGRAMHPERQCFVDVGLPYGPKPRLVLYHLNAEALRTNSSLIEVEDTFTAFVKRIGLSPTGRALNMVKDQLTRLSAADFRFGFAKDGRAVTKKGTIVDGFDLWFPKDDRQRVLWPTTVQFSHEYFVDLVEHAVPLNETAVAMIKDSAMALDIYTWLAQRLHRVPVNRPQFIPWPALQDQFGHGYTRLRKFREVFLHTLKRVSLVYPEARMETSDRGMALKHSAPPVPARLLPLR